VLALRGDLSSSVCRSFHGLLECLLELMTEFPWVSNTRAQAQAPMSFYDLTLVTSSVFYLSHEPSLIQHAKRIQKSEKTRNKGSLVSILAAVMDDYQVTMKYFWSQAFQI
jgi:hypothetical protein